MAASSRIPIATGTTGGGGPSPTAGLVAKHGGGPPEEHARPAAALYVPCGVGAGAAFLAGAPLPGGGLGAPGVAVAARAVYGVALVIGGTVFWIRRVPGTEPDRRETATFGTVHIVYGVALGVVVASGVLA